MKKLITLCAFFITALLTAQDINGTWYGLLSFPGGDLHINIHLTQNGENYTATMDIPEQGAENIPLNDVAFENNTLVFALKQAQITYKGTYENNGFTGTFKQGSTELPLNFSRQEVTVVAPKRPQEPKSPYPYYEENVTFKNDKAGITLAGTLTLPKKEGNFPAVILISGSGAQDRNSELLDHKPFLVLADYLTRNGIAVLRYDDRGTAESTGDFATATSQDFATDAAAAYMYLKTRKEVNPKKIGLMGHSEGGLIAPLVASENAGVAFVVMLAGPAIAGDEILMLQNYMIGKADNMPEEELTKLGKTNRKIYDLVKQENDIPTLKTKLKAVYDTESKALFISKGIPASRVDEYIDAQVDGLASPWYINFIKYNPAPALEKVKCPILALYGEKDLQVAPTANIEALKRIVEKSGNKKVTIKELPGLNHLFQTTETGAPAEYRQIEETFSPTALNEISTWIKQQVK
ncbi:alpha/beta hydrolase family protein [Flavobacterium rhizosphaerae]|uniref:Alpha/beta fold hydrolase n=1 Tax=Flavobacterium rhizosphaerae TaxID=3163298 RepID=A0ABW8YSG4_9FLAO